MKAAYIEQCGGTDVLRVGELPKPECSENEVCVKVAYSALNHLDVWVRKGQAGVKLEFPRILGSDASGIIESVGKKVKQLKPGDEVIVHPGVSTLPYRDVESLAGDYKILGEHCNGTNAEYVCVPQENIFAKPKNLSLEQAASIPLVFTTAWQMVVGRGEVQKGDLVLVHAAGSGVSSAAIQIARLFEADVIATAGSQTKLKRAKELGAETLVNYRDQDVVKEVRAQYGKRKVDLVIDHVGKDTWEGNFSVLRWGGKIVLCGATTGFDVKLDLRQIFYKQTQVLGSTMGSKSDFPTILKHFETGELEAVVDRSFELGEIAAAHQYIEDRKPVGKVLIKVS